MSSALSLKRGTAAVQCGYRTPRRTQASRTPWCVPEMRTGLVYYRRAASGPTNWKPLKSCMMPAGQTAQLVKLFDTPKSYD